MPFGDRLVRGQGARSSQEGALLRGNYAGPFQHVHTHDYIQHCSPAAAGECACPAHASLTRRRCGLLPHYFGLLSLLTGWRKNPDIKRCESKGWPYSDRLSIFFHVWLSINFRQACGYLPSQRASPPIGRYRIILLGDRGTCVWAAYPRLLPGSGPAEIRTRDI